MKSDGRGNKAGNLFNASSISPFGGPTLRWNILDPGRTRADVDRATARSEAAPAPYRRTVLAALQDAESSPSGSRPQGQNVARPGQESRAILRAASLTRDLNRAGTVCRIDSLDTERQWLPSRRSFLARHLAQLV